MSVRMNGLKGINSLKIKKSLKLSTELFIYSASFDNTVRKIDPDGNQVWSFTGHTSNLLGVAVDPGTHGAGFW